MLQEYGSIPTNPLVASARAAHVARSANDYGVITGGSSAVDMNKVEERTDAVVRRSSEGVEKCLKGTEYVMVYEGYARSLT
jgi:pyruvate/2-oxoglutarate dehydrogenase complex dihydrolipoamide dehydrogenase (E3) component